MGDKRISFVAENFLQEKDVFEYSSGDCFFMTASHNGPPHQSETKKRSIAIR
jgi:hypothetical protein